MHPRTRTTTTTPFSLLLLVGVLLVTVLHLSPSPPTVRALAAPLPHVVDQGAAGTADTGVVARLARRAKAGSRPPPTPPGKRTNDANRKAHMRTGSVRNLPPADKKIHAASGAVYTRTDAETAIKKAHESRRAVNPSGKQYPHTFSNRPNSDGSPAFPTEKTAGRGRDKLKTFPIKQGGGEAYDHSGPAGADRVVYKDGRRGKGPKFVGVISHDGPKDFKAATIK
ncbi:hypothetical protein DFJ73DRAFT_762832 [Zopfochytrium polystomum]|nr:hypothetical protein DFJ73DRAFT_762832 [Zopfochytrium polystomum]